MIVLFIMNMNNKKMIVKLTKRVDDLTSGGGGKSLEEELDQIIEDNRRLLSDSEQNSEDIRKIFERLRTVYQKMSIVKYDAYEQLGGEMSAVVVLLDENDDGILLNNVYSTEGGYVYTREIEKGKCRHELGAEEEQALAEALKR
ncbi:MAG: DUF4446 family protein [Lachnospiraceae bacterium]|nr:DUF4446 family protein [Lachnospiraceae bacterium]